MTVTDKSSRKRISGSGWANPLQHDFMLENAAYLEVYADDVQLSLGDDYTVAGVLDLGGYRVTINDPGDWAPDNWTLQVVMPIDQQKDVSLGGAFGARYEDGLDALTRRIQYLRDIISRAIVVSPLGDPDATYVFPLPESGRFLAGRADGLGWENSDLSLEQFQAEVDAAEDAADAAQAAADELTALIASLDLTPGQTLSKTITDVDQVFDTGITGLTKDSIVWFTIGGVQQDEDDFNLVAGVLSPAGSGGYWPAAKARVKIQGGIGITQSFYAGGTGATRRTVTEKLRESWVTPYDYGAVDNPAVNNTAAFLKWRDAVDAGKAGWVPKGRFLLRERLVFAKAPSIRGDGQGHTVLCWDGSASGAGIYAPFTSDLLTVNIRDLSLTVLGRVPAAGDIALQVEDVSGANTAVGPGIIENILMRGQTGPTADGWDVGLNGKNMHAGQYSGISFIGNVPSFPNYASTAGILLNGGTSVTEINITRPRIHYTKSAIEIASRHEGINVNVPTFVSNERGIKWRAPSGQPPQLTVAGGHIAGSIMGIDAEGLSEANISGVLFYALGGRPTADYTHINLKRCIYSIISANTFVEIEPVSNSYDVVLEDTTSVTVMPNMHMSGEKGIWVKSDADQTTIHKQTYGSLGVGGLKIINEGTRTFFPGSRVMALTNATQAITTATWTALNWGSVVKDAPLGHDVSNPSRLTAWRTGLYRISYNVNFAANTVGIRGVLVYRNGSVLAQCQTPMSANALAAGETNLSASSGLLSLSEGDYLEVRVYQTSAGNLNAQASCYATLELVD